MMDEEGIGWEKSGRPVSFVGVLPTPHGIDPVLCTARLFVGSEKLVDLAWLARFYVSSRHCAWQTFELFALGNNSGVLRPFVVREDTVERKFGDYEGLTVDKVRAKRHRRGL